MRKPYRFIWKGQKSTVLRNWFIFFHLALTCKNVELLEQEMKRLHCTTEYKIFDVITSNKKRGYAQAATVAHSMKL